MSTLIAVVTGGLVGIGLWIAIGAVAGWQLLPSRDAVAVRAGQLQRAVVRFAAAGLVALVTLAVTRWPSNRLSASSLSTPVRRWVPTERGQSTEPWKLWPPTGR